MAEFRNWFAEDEWRAYWDNAAPGKMIEKRQARDGNIYTKAEFVGFFGQSWEEEWQQAQQVGTNRKKNIIDYAGLQKFKADGKFSDQDIKKLRQPGVDLSGLWALYYESGETKVGYFYKHEIMKLIKPEVNFTSLQKILNAGDIYKHELVKLSDISDYDFEPGHRLFNAKLGCEYFYKHDLMSAWKARIQPNGLAELYTVFQNAQKKGTYDPKFWYSYQFKNVVKTGLDLRGVTDLVEKHKWKTVDIVKTLKLSATLPAKKQMQISHILEMLDNNVCSTADEVRKVLEDAKGKSNG